MTGRKHIVIVSDIHHAGEMERGRRDFEWKTIPNPFLRLLARAYFRYIWIGDPLGHAGLLDRFFERVPSPDLAVANGDFTVDSAFVGVSDDGACQSAGECLSRLRSGFGERFRATIGDHELGKINLFANLGGLRLESWRRATNDLGMRPFWRVEMGNYVILGITSTLVGLPVFEKEALPGEWSAWQALRETHLVEIGQAFAGLHPRQRVLLFCHDPTALPFLARVEAVRSRLHQLEFTIIGHLHTNLVLRQSRLLAGMPVISFLGAGVRRMSTALREARKWEPFKVRLCPALAGTQLMNDGGFVSLWIDPDAREPGVFQFQALPR
jgi:hypothetical protein